MKAHINGITVEGTPEEVWTILQKANSQGTNIKPYQTMPEWGGAWWGIFPPIGHGTADVPEYLKYPVIISLNVTE